MDFEIGTAHGNADGSLGKLVVSWVGSAADLPILSASTVYSRCGSGATNTVSSDTGETVESTLSMPELDQQEARAILQTILRQNRRLIQLVADLLFLARLERQPELIRRQCCLDDVVSDLVEEFEELASGAGVKLTAFLGTNQPLLIIGDEEQLYRLVCNLIVNAIQYTPRGSEVRLVLNCSDHHVLLQIQDTGIGIAPSEQRQIFDRFYRVNSDRRNTGGSGLGLAIAKRCCSSDSQSNCSGTSWQHTSTKLIGQW